MCVREERSERESPNMCKVIFGCFLILRFIYRFKNSLFVPIIVTTVTIKTEGIIKSIYKKRNETKNKTHSH